MLWLLDDIAELRRVTTRGHTRIEQDVCRARAEVAEKDVRRRGAILVTVIALAFAASALLTSIAAGARDTLFYQSRIDPAVPAFPSPASVVASSNWSFHTGLPDGWLTVLDVRVGHAPGGLRVTLGKTGAIASPPVTLQPGKSVLVVRGTIPDGGIWVRAIDATSNQAIASEKYWNAQTRDGPIELGVNVDTPVARPVRIAITNLSRRPDDASTAVINSATIYRTSDVDKLHTGPTTTP